MTSIKSRAARVTGETGPGSRGRRKSLLFCPECDREGDAVDDWDRVPDADGTAFLCPVCETVVARR